MFHLFGFSTFHSYPIGQQRLQPTYINTHTRTGMGGQAIIKHHSELSRIGLSTIAKVARCPFINFMRTHCHKVLHSWQTIIPTMPTMPTMPTPKCTTIPYEVFIGSLFNRSHDVNQLSHRVINAFHQDNSMAASALLHLALTDPKSDKAAVLLLACRCGISAVAESVIEYHPYILTSQITRCALHTAMSFCRPNLVKMILNQIKSSNLDFDHSFDDNALLLWAARNGHSDVIARLLSCPEVDPTAEDNRAIKSAIFNGYVHMTNLLLADKRIDLRKIPADNVWSAFVIGNSITASKLLKDLKVQLDDRFSWNPEQLEAVPTVVQSALSDRHDQAMTKLNLLLYKHPHFRKLPEEIQHSILSQGLAHEIKAGFSLSDQQHFIAKHIQQS